MLLEYRSHLNRIFRQKVQLERLKLREYQVKLQYLHPGNLLRDYQQRYAEYDEKLRLLMNTQLRETRHLFHIYLEKMKGLSPLEKLNQGYAYVETSDGKTLKSIEQAKPGEKIEVSVTDGVITATVDEIRKERR